MSKCKEFSEGKCSESENSCWFKHSLEEIESEGMEVDENTDESVFCKAQHKIPPDQISMLLIMIKKISIQVEKLEKSQKS